MKTYPYIGKCEENNLAVLFTSFRSGTTLHCGSSDIAEKHKYETGFNEREFKNITAEYLANTYGKVESKEHAEFIVKLAENAGFDIDEYHQLDEWFCFSVKHLFFFNKEFSAKDSKEKLITIPLPPKEKSTESQKEWPQVGDKALTNSLEKVEVLALDNGVVWVKHLVGDSSFGYLSVEAKYLSKPPTPEEELTSALLEYTNSDNYSCEWKGFAKSIINGEIKGLSYKPE